MASNTIPANTAAPSNSASAPTSAPLVEFTIFSRLVPELQDEIWKQTLPGPRLITIAERLTGALAALAVSPQGPTIHAFRNNLRALVRPPIALQITSKSRGVALLHYQPMYGNVLSAPVYMDPDKDILHFYNMRVLNVFDRVAAATYANKIEHPLIRAVAMPHRHLTTTPHSSLVCTMDVIKTWHRVKDIYMVSPTENGPINGFDVEEMKDLLTLHRRLVLDKMTVRERLTWTVPSVFFLREEDLEEIFG